MTPEPLFDEPRQACPTCRASYPLGVAVCAFCGCALPYPSPMLPTAEVPAPVAVPVQVFVEPESARSCAWCGLEQPPDAERCPRCGAAFTSDERQQAYANAALGLRMQAFRADAAAEEEGNRTARRWRWASWALGRIILRWPGNL